MMPINAAQMALLMQMQQMQQINNILQTSMAAYPQKQQMQSDEEDSEDDEVSKTLFVANLEERVDEELLYEVFLQAGPLERVHIPKNRTFAFITYAHTCSPIYAMNLFQGVSLYGKQIAIKFKGNANAHLVKRLLPPDWGILNSKTRTEQNQRSFENSAIRNPFADNGDNHRNENRYNRDLSPNGRRYDGSNRGSRDGRGGRDRPHNNRWSDSSRDRYDDRKSINRNGDKRRSHYV